MAFGPVIVDFWDRKTGLDKYRNLIVEGDKIVLGQPPQELDITDIGGPGTPFLAEDSLLPRNSIDRASDRINIKDDAIGDGTTETSAIAAFFTRVASRMGPVTPINIPATARGAYIPGGYYKSVQTTVPMIGVGYSIAGDGRLSQLENITLQTASQNQTISNLRLLDNPTRTNTGIFNNYILATISNVELNSKLIGVDISGAVGGGLITDCIFNSCTTGVRVNGNDNRLVNNRISDSTTAGVYMIDGGSLSMIGNWVQGEGPSVVIEGTGGASVPVESYFYLNTFTNDTNAYWREWSIASIVSSDAGATITVTFTAPHELSPGVGFIQMVGTGVTSYDTTRTWVQDVLSTTSVKLGRSWVSDVGAVGTLRAPGVDLDINSVGAGNANVRNMRFIGNNTNNTRLNGGANISFMDRLKTQIWMGGDASNQPNNIMIFRFPDGEYGGGATVDAPSNTIRNGDIRPSGPGSLMGYGEIGMLRTGIASYAAELGSLKMGAWVPFTEGGFTNHGGGNTPLFYNGFETLNTVTRITSNGVDHNISATTYGLRDPRIWDIASIATANAGASILVTTRTNIRQTPGISYARLAATGVTGYNGDWAIEAAPAVNQVQLGVAYVSDVGAVGTMQPVGRSINFREGGVGSNGVQGSPSGLDFTQHISAFRGVADDTIYGNAIVRFNSPISTTPAGQTQTTGFIAAPGNGVGTQRSLIFGTAGGNPDLSGDTASIRAQIGSALEAQNDQIRYYVDGTLHAIMANESEDATITLKRAWFAGQIDVGTRDAGIGQDPSIWLRRQITGDQATFGAAHGFTDNSLNLRTGSDNAYCSFDAKAAMGAGSARDFAHYAGFQSRPELNFTGTIGRCSMHTSEFRTSGAGVPHVNFVHHYYVIGDDDYAGTATNQYGLYVTEMTKATNNWGVYVENNKCKFSETIVDEAGRIQLPLGASGAGNLALWMGSDSDTGMYHRANECVTFQSDGEDRFELGQTGIIAMGNRDGRDAVADLRAYKASGGGAWGNAIISFSAPNTGTANGDTFLNKAFAVTFGRVSDAASQLAIGVAEAGYLPVDTPVEASTASDIMTLYNSINKRLDLFSLSSTAFASISSTSSSFVIRDTDTAHQFYLRNVNAGTSAQATFELQNGVGSGDLVGLVCNGTGYTPPSAITKADGATLYSGTGLAGGLTLAATATNATVDIYASGATNRIATFSNASGLVLLPRASVTLANNGELSFEATSDTSLTVKLRGSDGVTRTNVLTMA